MSFYKQFGNIPDLSQYGAVRTEDIESVTGPLPGSPGMEDPGFLGMFVEGVKEGFGGPIVGLGERLGLIKGGSRQDLREQFEQARLGYLAGDPGPFRTLMAGASEMLPSLVPLFPAGKAASALGASLNLGTKGTNVAARLFGAAEGALAGFGETAGQGVEGTLLGLGLGGTLGAALPAGIVKEGASKIDAARGVSTTFQETLETAKKRWLASAGTVDREVYEMLEIAQGTASKHQRDMSLAIESMSHNIKDHVASGRGMTEERLWQHIEYALEDRDGMALLRSISPDVAVNAQQARDLLDNLSEEMVSLSKLARKKFGTGLLTKAQEETYRANIGKYIHRSREAWDNKAFREKYTDSKGNWTPEWEAHIVNFMEETGKDREFAEGVMISALNKATGGEFNAPGGAKYLSPVDVRGRMHKKGGPAALRAMLNEYSDPRINLAKSMLFLSQEVEYNRQFMEVAEHYLDTGQAVLSERASEAFAHGLPDNRGLGVLRGRGRVRGDRPLENRLFFKDADVPAALIEGQEAAKHGFFRGLIGGTRWMKTVGSVVTHLRNFSSGNPMMGLQGHMPNMFDFKAWGLAFGKTDPRKISLDEIMGGKLVEYEHAYKKLLDWNIVQNSTVIGDIKAYRESANRLLKEGGSVAKIADKLEAGLTKIYQGTDDGWKVQMFIKEKARYKRLVPDLDDKALDKMAAQVTRDVMQVYSRVPKLVRAVRDFPLAGPFVSFPAEIIRNVVNTTKLATAELGLDFASEWATKYGFDALNDAQKAGLRRVGRRRMAGAMATLMAPIALAKASQINAGMTDEQVAALKESAVAPWSANSPLLILPGGVDEDGNVAFIDLGFMDPYAYFKKPGQPIEQLAKVMLSAMGNAPDSRGLQLLINSLEEAASPAIQPEIWAGEMWRGITALGKMEAVPADEKAKELMYRAYRMAAPGTVISLERFVRGFDAPGIREVLPATSKYGQRFKPGLEALSMTLGLRVSQSDLPKSLSWKGREYFSARGQGKRIYNDEARNKADRSVYRLSAAKRAAEDTNQGAGQELLRHIENFRTLGLTNQKIVRKLNEAGVSKKDAIDLVYYGKIPPIRF